MDCPRARYVPSFSLELPRRLAQCRGRDGRHTRPAGANRQPQTDCVGQDIGANGIAGCNGDAKCICGNSDFLSNIACCLAKPGGCSPSDQSSAVTFASQVCAVQGITVPSVVSCSTTQAASASGSDAATTTGGDTGSVVVTGATGSVLGTVPSTAWAPRETGLSNVLGGLVAVGVALL